MKKPLLITISLLIFCLLAAKIFSVGNQKRNTLGEITETKSESALLSRKVIMDDSKIRNEEELTIFDEVSILFKSDGAVAALKFVENLEGSQKKAALKFLLTKLAREDPEFVADHFNEFGLSVTDKAQIIQTLIPKWKDSERALEWASVELAGVLREDAVSLALFYLAEENIEGAIEYVEKIEPGSNRDQSYLSVMASWAKQDVESAIEYAKKSSEPNDFAMAMNVISPVWVKEDLTSAIDYFKSNSDSPELFLMGHLISASSNAGERGTTLDWLSKIEGVAAQRAIRSSVILWTDEDPSAVVSYIEEANSEVGAKLAPMLAGVWAQSDPEAAAEWVSHYMDPSIQAEMAVETVYKWYAIDPQEALYWVTTMPEGPLKINLTKFVEKIEVLPVERRFLAHPNFYNREAEDMALFSKKRCTECGVLHNPNLKH